MAGTQSFSGIDAAKWKRITDKIEAATGIAITTNNGTAGAKGITITWTYNPTTEGLNVTLVSRKFFDPSADVIDHDINDLVTNA